MKTWTKFGRIQIAIVILLVYAMAVFTTSCDNTPATSDIPKYDTLYKTQYAEKFEVLCSEDTVVLRVHNPWQGASGISQDYKFPRKAIMQPKIICMSSSHVAFMDAIGASEDIAGVSGRDFISNPKIRLDNVPDVGYDNNLNYELIVSLKPDYIFIYEVAGENSATTKKLEQLGIPVIYIADYLEKSPLARAEWVVAFGAVMGRLDNAVTVFDEIAYKYNQIKDKVAESSEKKPKVMLNSPYKDVWYIPGDRSYVVQLINDAGGDYLGKGVDDDISRPVSTEVAYKMLSEADLWLHPSIGTNSIAEIRAENHRFVNLPVVKKGEIYNNNARSTPAGGSDFWESGSLGADRVLQDLAKIFHPELFPDTRLYYYKKLN